MAQLRKIIIIIIITIIIIKIIIIIMYRTSDNQLTGLIKTVKNVSDDIKMKFGLDKCAKASFKTGKKVSAEGIPLNDNQVIQDLDQDETYKYLGEEGGEGNQHYRMKVKIRKEYKRRIKLVLKQT